MRIWNSKYEFVAGRDKHSVPHRPCKEMYLSSLNCLKRHLWLDSALKTPVTSCEPNESGPCFCRTTWLDRHVGKAAEIQRIHKKRLGQITSPLRRPLNPRQERELLVGWAGSCGRCEGCTDVHFRHTVPVARASHFRNVCYWPHGSHSLGKKIMSR